MKDLKLSDILLVSDLDGTLVTNKGVIPERNIKAIRRFIEKGGRFTFATGRSVMGTLKFTTQVAPNAPIITYNGGCIYDLEKRETLWNTYLPPSALELIKEVKRSFPDVGIEVYSAQNVYAINRNEYTKAHISFGNLTEFERTVDDMPEHLNKILLCSESERLQEVAAHLEKLDHRGCVFVFSGPIYFEILPAGISKGHTVKILADMLNIPLEHIMGIGDYYNDLELIQVSSLSAVPEEAPPDLKDTADLIVGPCAGGAVADFIEYIEAEYD